MPSWAAPRPSRAAKRNRLQRDWGKGSVSGNMQQPRNHQKHQLKPLQSKRLIPKPSGPVNPEGSEYLGFAQRTRSILYWMPSKETHSRFQVHSRCMCILSASKGLEGKGREHFYIRHPPQGKGMCPTVGRADTGQVEKAEFSASRDPSWFETLQDQRASTTQSTHKKLWYSKGRKGKPPIIYHLP